MTMTLSQSRKITLITSIRQALFHIYSMNNGHDLGPNFSTIWKIILSLLHTNLMLIYMLVVILMTLILLKVLMNLYIPELTPGPLRFSLIKLSRGMKFQLRGNILGYLNILKEQVEEEVKQPVLISLMYQVPIKSQEDPPNTCPKSSSLIKNPQQNFIIRTVSNTIKLLEINIEIQIPLIIKLPFIQLNLNKQLHPH